MLPRIPILVLILDGGGLLGERYGAVILNRRAGRRARAFLVAFDAKRTIGRLRPEVLRG